MTKELYKEAFLKQLASKFKGSYVMDAVRAARPQNAASAAEEAMTLHGTVLGALKQNGAVGADTMGKVLNKGRSFLGDVDTALGAAAMGKKNVQDASANNFRKSMFTFKTDNYRKVEGEGGLHSLQQQSRPSISAPLRTASRIIVPSLAMMKGQELIEGYRNKEVNHAGDTNQSSQPM
ncbi:MAG: hypothetical protein PHY48_17820 [Candidatus Cloacimonetes bacterium]|nr:hypothetical protein [Candidatus Cloacimonadota bacterium]